MGDLSHDFSRWEFECPDGCGFDTVNPLLITVLQTLREDLGERIDVNSGCRCCAHNRKTPGSSSCSFHLPQPNSGSTWAADISSPFCIPRWLRDLMDKNFPGLYGVKLYRTHIHIDVRSGHFWRAEDGK